jgi:hypothetical protein
MLQAVLATETSAATSRSCTSFNTPHTTSGGPIPAIASTSSKSYKRKHITSARLTQGRRWRIATNMAYRGPFLSRAPKAADGENAIGKLAVWRAKAK